MKADKLWLQMDPQKDDLKQAPATATSW